MMMQDPRKDLRQDLIAWIPHQGVVEAYKVKKLYPWQACALECGEDGSNLVYCAPTSGETKANLD